MFIKPKLARLGVAAAIAAWSLLACVTLLRRFWEQYSNVQIAVLILLFSAFVFFATKVSWAYIEGRNGE